MRTAGIFLLAACLFQCPRSYASKIDTEIQKIEAEIKGSNEKFRNLKIEIESISKKIDGLSKKKKLTSSKIKSISNQMHRLTKKVRALNAEYTRHKKNLRELTRFRKETALQHKHARTFLSENIKQSAIRKAGERTCMELFLVDYKTSFQPRINEFLANNLLEKVFVFAGDCSQKILELEEKVSGVEKSLGDLEIMLEDISHKISTNKRLQKTYTKALKKMQSQEDNLQKDLRQKEKDKEHLDRMIEKFMKKKKNLLAEKEKEKEFIKKMGALPHPVKGRIVSRFGRKKHPELETYIINRGIKIKSSTDTVRAVKEGTISFAGLFKGYGKTVIIDHGGGFYTVIAEMSKLLVNEGDTVSRGHPVGKCPVGGTLYFEIRKAGVPVDPEQWLE